MASTYSASLRLEMQGAGENPNSWGAPKLNNVISRLDFAVAGLFTKALTGDYTLTSANNADDEARAAILKFTGGAGPFTVTIPSVPKEYKVWNACSGAVIITTGGPNTVTIQPTEIAEIICDGASVKATGYDGRTEKQYLDARLVEAGAMPAGGIIMWSGAVASIPSGYLLCNGANGTPDLRDRFVVGAGASYPPGATGGANSVTLGSGNMPSHAHFQQGTFVSGGQTSDHTHGGYTDFQGNHTHAPSKGWIYGRAGTTGDSIGVGGDATNYGNNPLDYQGNHQHGVQTYGASNDHAHYTTIGGATSVEGGGAAHENRPPFYALCFIMKT